MERSRRTRECLGRGTEHVVWKLNDHAIKFSSSIFLPFPTHRLTGVGSQVLDRVIRDIEILKEYLGEEYLIDTKVKWFNNLWWLVQPNARDLPPVSSQTINEQVMEDLVIVARNAKRMKQETGLSLDWLGLSFFGYIKDFLCNKDFWVLPNILVTHESRPSVKVCDVGLVYSIRRPLIATGEGIFPNRVETLLWDPISELILKTVQERSGIELT